MCQAVFGTFLCAGGIGSGRGRAAPRSRRRIPNRELFHIRLPYPAASSQEIVFANFRHAEHFSSSLKFAKTGGKIIRITLICFREKGYSGGSSVREKNPGLCGIWTDWTMLVEEPRVSRLNRAGPGTLRREHGRWTDRTSTVVWDSEEG